MARRCFGVSYVKFIFNDAKDLEAKHEQMRIALEEYQEKNQKTDMTYFLIDSGFGGKDNPTGVPFVEVKVNLNSEVDVKQVIDFAYDTFTVDEWIRSIDYFLDEKMVVFKIVGPKS